MSGRLQQGDAPPTASISQSGDEPGLAEGQTSGPDD